MTKRFPRIAWAAAWLGLSLAAAPAARSQAEGHVGSFPAEYLELFDGDEVSIEINLFGAMLNMVSAFVGDAEPEFAALVGDLEEVRVRSGELSPARLDEVRERFDAGSEWLGANGWVAMVRVSEPGSEVRVFARPADDALMGLTVLALEENEATVVNLIGRIDPKTIARLIEGFDINGVDIDRLEDLPPLEEIEP